jgi:hypothetical protein
MEDYNQEKVEKVKEVKKIEEKLFLNFLALVIILYHIQQNLK